MPLDYISRRVASRTHIAQIEALRRAEGTANAVEREIRAASKRATAAAIAAGSTLDTRGVHSAVEGLWREVAQIMLRRFEAMASWSHQQAANALVETVPRNWWKILIPSLPSKVKEATVLPAGGMVPPDFPPRTGIAAPAPDEGDPCNPLLPPPPGFICVGGLLVQIQDEPIRAGKLTGKQRDKLVKELIFPPLSPERTSQIVFSPDSQGQSWVQRLQALSRQVTQPEALASQIIQGISSGENVQQLTQRIGGQFDLAASSARRIARTEAKRVSLQAQADSFESIGPLLIGYQHNAQLDQNTRPDHAARNGKIYYLEPTAGQDSVDEMIIPPGKSPEPNCRCWASPVLAPPEEIKSDPRLAADFANAAGEEIPDPTVYDRWFQTADDGARMDAVGVRRYKAMKDVYADTGQRPEWVDFVDPEGNLMSVTALKNETPQQRAERRYKAYELFRDREEAIQTIRNVGFVM